jgi:hypothetical protein
MIRLILAAALCLVAGVVQAQVLEGAPIDANNAPGQMRVVFKGQTLDLPLTTNRLVIPPWWLPDRASEWKPATSGEILIYETPKTMPVRWSIIVIRRPAGDWMRFGVYDGQWRHVAEYRFRSINDSGVLSIDPN